MNPFATATLQSHRSSWKPPAFGFYAQAGFEIVSHAAGLADVSGMFLRQPFFHMTVTETFPHVLAW